MENIKTAFLTAVGALPAKLFLYKATDSTNERAKQADKHPCGCEVLTLGGTPDTSLIIADTQTAGRGRLGRSFESPAGAGLYMSLTVRLGIPLSEALYVTPLAAVICARTIEALSGADIKIKWVNDLYSGGKKLAGILTEVISSEGGSCTLVIGIGINLKKSALSPEVSKIATSLEEIGAECERGTLAAALTAALLGALAAKPDTDIINEYRTRSCLIGERVTVTTPTDIYPAEVLDIDGDFSLVIKTEQGNVIKLTSGDVQRIKHSL